MEASGYQAACPVASVALETCGTSESIAASADGAFLGWEKLIARRLRDTGMKKRRARELGRLTLTMLEGALTLSSIRRTTVPLDEAGEHMYEVLGGG